MLNFLFKIIVFNILAFIISLGNLKAQSIVKNGQFLFLKNYESSTHFFLDDSLVFVNNKNSNTIDVFNLFQKKFIKKINHQIASIGYFFEFNSYAVKRDPPFSPNLGIRKNITNAVYILNDSSSFYFLSTQNSELYFTKINKSDYSEIWKFKIKLQNIISLRFFNICINKGINF
jgi:hypothetical protein